MERIDEYNFHLIGISHKTAPVEIREQVSVDGDRCGGILCGIRGIRGVQECVVLSTCNRMEIYTVIEASPDTVLERIHDYLISATGSDPDIREHFYYLRGRDMIAHLFRVASGIDSMILGEPQIFGQVKDAYSTACDYRCTGPALNRLFHHTFRVGKAIRRSTAIGEGAVSVSFAAVTLARSLFGSLDRRNVLLVGAGKIGELCAKRLNDHGISSLYIANRTRERAKHLAGQLGGTVAPFDDLASACSAADIIITSVGGREPVLNSADIAAMASRRGDRPLFLIDLGVPRNISCTSPPPANVHLYNIDDLESVTAENLVRREQEIGEAEEIIGNEVEEYRSWLTKRELIPVIRELRETCEAIRLKELGKLENKVDRETYETLDMVTRRLVRKILHQPISAIRSTDTGSYREQLVQTVQNLFIDCDPES